MAETGVTTARSPETNSPLKWAGSYNEDHNVDEAPSSTID